MLRILFAAVTALTLCAPAALACDGQTGNVIFEDKFTDDSGGWAFGENNYLVLKAPGAALAAAASDGGSNRASLNQTFTAAQGDFCVEMSFPAEAVQLDASIGVSFLATDYSNYWTRSSLPAARSSSSSWSTTGGQWFGRPRRITSSRPARRM
jgi:hypothetical protein